MGMRKKYGQNFLINPAVRSKLLDTLELKEGQEVWEIGAGLGAMTSDLLERGARVTAFEIDPGFSRALEDFFGHNSGPAAAFRLVKGDVLKTWGANYDSEWKDAGQANPAGKPFLFGNLPYNIAAALLAGFIEKGCFFKRMVVTVQREIAQRMAAGPGSPDYSSFSVLCSSMYRVSPLMVIKAASFYPAPRVDSQGVRLDLLANTEKKSPLFYPLVRSLFSSRRKTIHNTLTAFASSVIMNSISQKESVVPAPKEAFVKEVVSDTLKKAGVSGDRRAETLAIDEFAALAVFLKEIVSYGT